LGMEENASAPTARSYGSDLRQLLEFLAARKGCAAEKVRCAALDRDAVRAFLVDRLRANRRSSAARKLSAVKRLVRHLIEHKALPSDPTAGISAPRADRRLPHPLTGGHTLPPPPAPAPPPPAGACPPPPPPSALSP